MATKREHHDDDSGDKENCDPNKMQDAEDPSDYIVNVPRELINNSNGLRYTVADMIGSVRC